MIPDLASLLLGAVRTRNRNRLGDLCSKADSCQTCHARHSSTMPGIGGVWQS
jgi:hypothetical protein